MQLWTRTSGGLRVKKMQTNIMMSSFDDALSRERELVDIRDKRMDRHACRARKIGDKSTRCTQAKAIRKRDAMEEKQSREKIRTIPSVLRIGS